MIKHHAYWRKMILLCLCFGAIAVVGFRSCVQKAQADTDQIQPLYINEYMPAIRPKAFTQAVPSAHLSITGKKGSSTADLNYNFKEISSLDSAVMATSTSDSTSTAVQESYGWDNYSLPDGLKPASALYMIDLSLTDDQASLNDFAPKIVLSYPNNGKLMHIYFWDETQQIFVKAQDSRDVRSGKITVPISDLGQTVFALLEEPAATGRASWYVHPKYPKELMAASTDFSVGTKVKVTNLANNKSVIVIVKDWGPDPLVHPDRVIDLSKVAFNKIATTRAGVINVKVEPYVATTTTSTLAAATKIAK